MMTKPNQPEALPSLPTAADSLRTTDGLSTRWVRTSRHRAEADRDEYRLPAQAALAHGHDLTMTVRRQRTEIVRLREIVREHIWTPAPRRERRPA